jgi:hypothetical protein
MLPCNTTHLTLSLRCLPQESNAISLARLGSTPLGSFHMALPLDHSLERLTLPWHQAVQALEHLGLHRECLGCTGCLESR